MSIIYFKNIGLSAIRGRISYLKGKLMPHSMKDLSALGNIPGRRLMLPALLKAENLPAFISDNLKFSGKYVIHKPTGYFAVGSDVLSHKEIAKMAIGKLDIDISRPEDVTMGSINMSVLDLGKTVEFDIDSATGFDRNMLTAVTTLRSILKQGGYGINPERSYVLPNGARMIKLVAVKL